MIIIDITIMNIEMSKTNIQISRNTRNRLAELGSKTDTYDDIVCRLIDFYYEHQ